MNRTRLLIVCALLWPVTAFAQFTADYQTNVISGVVSNWSGSYIVGSDTAFDLLRIENGGVLSNDHCYVGFQAIASNNAVIVSGSNSVWRNNSGIVVGLSGPACQLIVTNGAHAEDGAAILGHESSSSNNVVIIDGVGSVWSNLHDVVVGDRGGNNYLVISDGGKVYDDGANVGDWPSSSNLVTVTGKGSLWSNSTTLFFGDDKLGNEMIISKGGAVFDMSGYIGTGSTASNNVVIVDGAGSVWGNASNLFIGFSGGANQLVITNGGGVYSSTSGIGDSGDSNTVIVTGTGSTWSNGVFMYIGGSGHSNRLMILDGGVVANGRAKIGPSYDTVVVSGSGSTWKNQGDIFIGNLFIGSIGDSNQLIITDGGCVVASNIYVGSICGGNGNGINISGGSLYVTNADHTAVLDARFGLVTLSSGLLKVDTLIITSSCGRFIHTGGSLVVGTLVLDPAMDADGDGMPNGWEQTHGLDPLNPADANIDSDGDGMSNLQEYLAGTDPLDRTSPYRITAIAQEGDDIRVTWVTVGGKTNFVQATSDPASNFTDISSAIAIIGANVTWTNYLDAGALTNFPSRLYRIRLVP